MRRLEHARAFTRWPLAHLAASTLLLLCSILAQAESDVAAKNTREAARLNNIGTALMNQQLFDAAETKFQQASQLDPTLAAAELNRGIAFLYLQKTIEAARALQHAAEMAPNDPRSWYALGLLYRTLNETDAGIASFRRVLALAPSNADSHYFLGTFLLQQQKADQAITAFKEALQLDPLHASAEFGLARALQRNGSTEEARGALAKFQHMTETRIASPITHSYGEEGSLGRVEDAPSEKQGVSRLIPITFRASEPRAPQGGVPSAPSGEDTRGSCLIDMRHDGRLKLIVPEAGKGTAFAAYQLATKSTDTTSLEQVPVQDMGLQIGGDGVACAVGDFDNDGLSDIAVSSTKGFALFHNLGNNKFEDVTKTAGISPSSYAAEITFFDFDHDGDLDIFLGGRSSSALWRNNGNGTFTEWTKQTGLDGSQNVIAAIPSDVNNDRATDLFVIGDTPVIYFNPRSGPFHPMSLYSEKKLPPPVGATVFDFDKDGWMDVALVHSGKPGLTLWRNVDGKRFERVSLPSIDGDRAWGIAALDIDNDGWIDLAVGISTASGPALKILRNLGPAGFADVSQEVGLNNVALESPQRLIATHMNEGGASDLIVTQSSGAPIYLQNVGGSKNHSLRISLKGLADNKSAIGTKVEVFADGMWQKWEVTTPQDILAGIGASTKADLVRFLWPTGVPQDEIDVPIAREMAVTELDRRGSSCPTLFAWDGYKFGFISDVIGAAVIGHWTAPQRYNTPDPDEWIKIDGAQVAPEDGQIRLRFGEPMEEVNFVDQIRLVAIDHPGSASVYPNERFLSEPPFVRHRVVVSTHAHPAAGAWDDHGRDVLDKLRYRDRVYVSDFTKLPYTGFANRHNLTLDLGPWTDRHPPCLFLHGFIEYFSATSMYAAWQSGNRPIPPYVEAQLPDGSWKRIVDDMGFPAGLPRTIVVDLHGKLPSHTRRIRIVSNLQIYWDQVLIDDSLERLTKTSAFHRTELPLTGADLQFRGYPEQRDGATPGDLSYNYQRKSQTGPFVRQRGAYTRYGDVTPLLKKIDDKDVIFGTGEDIDLRFTTSALPHLPGGWVRDYLFYANGFVKDMDFYDASPFTVAALPFHAMKRYPYGKGEHYPADATHNEYQIKWNDRFESGAGAGSYEFNYHYDVTAKPSSGAAKH